MPVEGLPYFSSLIIFGANDIVSLYSVHLAGANPNLRSCRLWSTWVPWKNAEQIVLAYRFHFRNRLQKLTLANYP
jgi:hypothetical protein